MKVKIAFVRQELRLRNLMKEMHQDLVETYTAGGVSVHLAEVRAEALLRFLVAKEMGLADLRLEIPARVVATVAREDLVECLIS